MKILKLSYSTQNRSSLFEARERAKADWEQFPELGQPLTLGGSAREARRALEALGISYLHGSIPALHEFVREVERQWRLATARFNHWENKK